MKKHLNLLGVEGKAIGRDLCVRLLRSGVKVSIAGDLWSDKVMGLFGIYAHGIVDWSTGCEKALSLASWRVRRRGIPPKTLQSGQRPRSLTSA